MKLNDTEIVLLRQLRDDGEQTISGNKLRRDLNRVIRAGYVNDVAISVDAVLYRITDFGRAALAAAQR
jgi:hypothetical protein